MAHIFGTQRSIVVRPTPAALRLKELALNFLDDFDKSAGIVYDDIGSRVERRSFSLSQLSGNLPQFHEETLLEMAKNVIDEMTYGVAGGPLILPGARRELALKIEQLLWEPPLMRNSDEDVSLDELSNRLGVSRRTIQIALQEQFGVGFVALRRLIRLHQIRLALRLEKRKKISQLAADFYVSHFGRFSKDYKELFGLLPSAELKNL